MSMNESGGVKTTDVKIHATLIEDKFVNQVRPIPIARSKSSFTTGRRMILLNLLKITRTILIKGLINASDSFGDLTINGSAQTAGIEEVRKRLQVMIGATDKQENDSPSATPSANKTGKVTLTYGDQSGITGMLVSLLVREKPGDNPNPASPGTPSTSDYRPNIYEVELSFMEGEEK